MVTEEVKIEWMPVAQAAALLCVTRQRVHQLIGSGRLSAVSMHGTTLVQRTSVLARVELLRKQAEALVAGR
jgi:hypothetical protein